MDLAFLINSWFTALADRKLKPQSTSDGNSCLESLNPLKILP